LSVRRGTENAISVGTGSQLAYQLVEVLTQVYPEYFTQVPALEGLLITLVAIFISAPLSLLLAWYGKKQDEIGRS
jgi:hypothetical protein